MMPTVLPSLPSLPQQEAERLMVSREHLYKLVWLEPMTKVAARFAVSGSYMARMALLQTLRSSVGIGSP